MASILLSDFSRVILDLRPGFQSDTLNGFWDDIVAKQPDADPLEYFAVNEDLLDFYRSIRSETPIHLYTDGRLHTLSPIAQRIAGIFAEEFKGDARLPKKAPESYRAIASTLGVDPQEIIFVDDKMSHIEAAREAGCAAVLHTDTAATIAALRELIPQ